MAAHHQVAGGWAAAATSTTFLTENWNGVTPPALPTGWTVTAISGITLATNASTGYGGGNSLRGVVNSATYSRCAAIYTAAADSVIYKRTSGNVVISSKVRFDVPSGGSALGATACLEGRIGEEGDHTSSYYSAQIFTGYGYTNYNLTLVRRLYGKSEETIGSIVNFTLDRSEWYIITLTLQGNTQACSLQRTSDSQYLQANGTFSATPANCCTATDTLIPRAGYVGFQVDIDEPSGLVDFDDLLVTYGTDTLPPALPYTAHTPGQRWFDSVGNPVNLLSGCIFKDPNSSLYYGYGDDYTGPTYQLFPSYGRNGVSSTGTWVSSSTDLINWTPLGKCYTNTTGFPIVQRPKVIWNALTSKYVMYCHLNDVTFTQDKVAILTSSNPYGPFTVQSTIQPDSTPSRDMTLFQEGTNAYLVSSDDAGNMNIYQLSSDYLTPGTKHTIISGGSREAPVMWKNGSDYFLVTSGLTFWLPNQQTLYTSTTPLSGWSLVGNFGQASGTESNSVFFRMQGAHIIVTGTDTIFLADRWNEPNFADSQSILLKVTYSGSTPQLSYTGAWTPSV